MKWRARGLRMSSWHLVPGRLRLVIAATPKTGNVWLKSLLSEVYRLPLFNIRTDEYEVPRVRWRRYVTHQHYMPRPWLLEWGARERVQFVTVVRHPADVFVSYYHYVNSGDHIIRNRGRHGIGPAHVMIGEDIDSPTVLRYLESGFKEALGRSIAWIESGSALAVRYEELSRSPVSTLEALTNQIEPVNRGRLEAAVSLCQFDTMRRFLKTHCRRGAAGGWRDELGPTHLEILASGYAEEFSVLGYPVDF
jgi:hypothetical protein